MLCFIRNREMLGDNQFPPLRLWIKFEDVTKCEKRDDGIYCQGQHDDWK